MPRESAGGVIVGKDGKVVLVRQHNNSWALPKGGVAGGESLLETAKREIEEETGIKDLELIQELGSYERYSIGPGGVGEVQEWGSQKKTFFLFKTNETQLASRDDEVTDARWVTLDEAVNMLTHPKDAAFLKGVKEVVIAKTKPAEGLYTI